ncbi:hypothetical protein FC75_GL001371 [Lacticaseibacillus camelliae DSM 22697 = JCM 13995]|uniref:Uncharacterized protein n=2 Tax=Lacticaseibacillus camelliae TaxID=381742 RepID=A0A0R2F5V2_9LACO|nr:hypothetical protein FC75_GL001371 [Lacticaseibacillus camelliae DSM 22697 = JCM 13995]
MAGFMLACFGGIALLRDLILEIAFLVTLIFIYIILLILTGYALIAFLITGDWHTFLGRSLIVWGISLVIDTFRKAALPDDL